MNLTTGRDRNLLQVDPSMVVHARIRLPAFPSPCLYQIFCLVRSVIHALCCYFFLCLDAFIAHASQSFIIHASHSFIVHASHSPIVHASHSFAIHASHSHSLFMRTHSLFMCQIHLPFMHRTHIYGSCVALRNFMFIHLPFMRRTHSPFMYQPCIMQLGVSLIFSSP